MKVLTYSASGINLKILTLFLFEMIDVRQIRAARALLDWSQADLAQAVGMAASTIKAIEAKRATPRRDTFELIAATLEDNGVELMPGSGVRLKSRFVTVHQGRADRAGAVATPATRKT